MKKYIFAIILFMFSTFSVYAVMTKSEVMEMWSNDTEVTQYRQQIASISNKVSALISKYEQDRNAISNQNPGASASALLTLMSSITVEHTRQLNILNSEHTLIQSYLDIANYKYQRLLDSIKAYSTYAILDEYKDGSATVSYKDSNGYLKQSRITVYGCYDLQYLVGGTVVLNLMDDGILNYGDYIVYGSSNQSCSISYSNDSISNNITLNTSSCGKYSIPLNGKCSCLSGYVWEYPDDSKNFDCKVKSIALTPDQNCQVAFGDYAISVGYNKCDCKSKYKWTANKKSCEPEPIYTTPIKTTKKLVCKKGELIRNNKCVNPKTLK